MGGVSATNGVVIYLVHKSDNLVRLASKISLTHRHLHTHTRLQKKEKKELHKNEKDKITHNEHGELKIPYNIHRLK